jgi:hypothetical protein
MRGKEDAAATSCGGASAPLDECAVSVGEVTGSSADWQERDPPDGVTGAYAAT